VTLLPHCLSKINRFAYGLLHANEVPAANPRMSAGRQLAAVPFVGKDTPSRSSEFAHPDVTIGLTTLAYRYEGLRRADVRRLLVFMLRQHHAQAGPVVLRPERCLFQRWIQGATETFGTQFPDSECPQVRTAAQTPSPVPSSLLGVLCAFGLVCVVCCCV